ncbi:hypothetical protein Acr_00g0045270 [Actinidia rufa]|uniref:Uncharacterized protein n=1 Tax=Actinidia rufa TaxID=165716 RepID=A0A7J0DJB4_9ERIC|nr:hypothetical protein Acr_00g0045270 [Actinidia rufa]
METSRVDDELQPHYLLTWQSAHVVLVPLVNYRGCLSSIFFPFIITSTTPQLAPFVKNQLQTFTKPFLIASYSSNYSDSRKTHRESPYGPQTPRYRGIKEPTLPPWESWDKRQHKTHVSVDNRSDSKTVGTSKWRRTPKQTKSGMDLYDMLNAKRNQEFDLQAKLNGHKEETISKVVPVGSAVRTAHKGRLPQDTRFHSLEKSKDWTHQRSSHYQGSIENFYQLTESFIAQFVVNKKVPKGVEECFEELAVASYKLGLTPGERLWENLTINPPIDLRYLMSRVEMFAWLEDDVRQAEKAMGTPAQGEGPFKKRKENIMDYRIRARQGINVVFKELIYKLLAWIRDKPYFKKPELVGGDLKRRNQTWKCSFHE